MFKEAIVKDQAGNQDDHESSTMTRVPAVKRRSFLHLTMFAASGLALSSALPAPVRKILATALQGNCPTPPALQDVFEIKSSGKTLKAVLKILDEKKTYLAAGCVPNTGQMRYFEGYDVNNPGKVWPTTHGVPTPGPTLRARVGDQIQITLLNQVNVKNFPGTLDVAETGLACDQNKSVGPNGSSVNTYPGDPSFEHPPNCYHGSSSTNLHFHGSHVSPSGISDNILLNIRPTPFGADGKPIVNEKSVAAIFSKIFAACTHGHQPMLWSDWPPEWQAWQKKLLIEYDQTAVWKGQRGALPPDERLWTQNQKSIANHLLPQYYVGAYPTCFKIPEWNGQQNSMGQAPGTHWYHAHKHGSTTLNLSNGMAGALIIEGDYDDKLKPFFTRQHVLVLQQYAAVLAELRSGFAPQSDDLVLVNGQYTPVLHMNPNEMQLWRLINACHQAGVPLDSPTDLKWVQTAQDGVQFNPANYDPSVTNASFPIPARSTAPFGSLAAGNRVDLLVQAPSNPGQYKVTFGGTLLLTVNVSQDPAVPAIANPMPFPTRAQFPPMPGFLADINPSTVKKQRDLHFQQNPTPPTNPNFPNPPSTLTIDDKQFQMGVVNQTMQLGDTEEWTLYNEKDGAAHPFHIHVNPFQVVEIQDPNQNNGVAVKLPRPWVWWDNFAIPPGGYVKILTRFVDFTGMFVLHCHILDHEDRGMMQLVQVCTDANKCPKTTTMTHK
ncbi:MAG TPA: multicopper oxidase domain-containing protein [Pyrinomonadaceae bacterium]|nr:multicopper oxidase domain-containing protein [Pyrinomonadaceae bacterium]